VALLTTIALDLLLAFTLLFSVQIAAGWGELCGIRPGGDKSGLGGFMAIYMFCLFRWLVLAACLAGLSAGDERWLLLGAHTALGIVSIKLFERGVQRVQNDRMVSDLVGLLGSTLLPLPACTLVVQRANASWLGDSSVTLAVVAAALAALHLACYRARRRDMLRSRA
jgi:hypothetical protein